MAVPSTSVGGSCGSAPGSEEAGEADNLAVTRPERPSMRFLSPFHSALRLPSLCQQPGPVKEFSEANYKVPQRLKRLGLGLAAAPGQGVGM